jgi:hypothetical protein
MASTSVQGQVRGITCAKVEAGEGGPASKTAAKLQPWNMSVVSPGGLHMKYGIDFRYLPKGASAPLDNSYPVDVEVDESQFALIPALGDHVCIPGDNPGMRNVPLFGRVRSRLFHYRLGYCYVTIVVEDSEEEFSKIGKT